MHARSSMRAGGRPHILGPVTHWTWRERHISRDSGCVLRYRTTNSEVADRTTSNAPALVTIEDTLATDS